MPFGHSCEFPDFGACVTKMTGEVDDPEAFCGSLMRDTEESCGGKQVAKQTTDLGDVTVDGLKTSNEAKLRLFHQRAHVEFSQVKVDDRQSDAPALVRVHVQIVEEMEDRGIEHRLRPGGLDTARAVQVGKSADDVALIPSYISLVGDPSLDPLRIVVQAEGMSQDDKEYLARQLLMDFDPDRVGKGLKIRYDLRGPEEGQTFQALYDLLLRRSTGERELVKASGLRLTTLGIGATGGPKFSPSGLLVEYQGVRVMIDGGPGSIPTGKLDAWLVTNEKSVQLPEIQKAAEEVGVRVYAGPFHRGAPDGGLTISPHPVEYVGHPTYGYEITVLNKKIVWAPEFFEFPKWAAGADLMFAEAAGWDRPVLNKGGGGHMAAQEVAATAKRQNVKRLVFAHVGRPMIRAIAGGAKPLFGEVGDAGEVYILRSATLMRSWRRMVQKARHRRDKCMVCKQNAPQVDVLWAEGAARAWFCKTCFTVWKKEHKGDVVKEHVIEGGDADWYWASKAVLTVDAVPTTRQPSQQVKMPEHGGLEMSVDDESETMEAMDFDLIVTKAARERQYTFGVMYKATNERRSPELDAHDEFVTADKLQESQWGYVKTGDRTIYRQHGLTGLQILGEWVDIVSWPEEVKATLTLPGEPPRKTTIPANSIWMGILWSNEGWKLVKSGLIRGLSMGGTAKRRQVTLRE